MPPGLPSQFLHLDLNLTHGLDPSPFQDAPVYRKNTTSGSPPQDGEGLTHLRFTRRRKEKILFDAEDAGMSAYVCCRYENQKGQTGQWGPVASAVIT
jgi:hypothetical protein